jgi:arginyl-tRNA synthetase
MLPPTVSLTFDSKSKQNCHGGQKLADATHVDCSTMESSDSLSSLGSPVGNEEISACALDSRDVDNEKEFDIFCYTVSMHITHLIRTALSAAIGDSAIDARVTLEAPRDASHGDLATNAAMVLAKSMAKPPRAVAETLIATLQKDVRLAPLGLTYEIAGPGFINMRVSAAALAQLVARVRAEADGFGSSTVGAGKTVVVDYSGPNIAKPMHVGHLRSTVIGQALVNMYRFAGWRVIGDNHLGDWGTQFGKLLVMYKKAHGENVVPLQLEDLTKLYVSFTTASEADPSLEDAARAETKKLQDGDPLNRELWRHFTTVSMQDFERIYELLGVKIDYAYGESFYQDKFAAAIELAVDKGVAKESEGALIIEFAEETKLPPFLLRKSDGAAMYGTSDVATLIFRKETWNPDNLLYVVANEQSLHFSQVFAVSEMLGVFSQSSLEHVKFGMVLGADGKKFSTRRGTGVGLYEVLEEAIERSRKIVDEKSPELPADERQQIARIVGVSAVIFNDLSQNRVGDIRFDWDTMLSLDGNSAPYLLYTYARLQSVLRKAGEDGGVTASGELTGELGAEEAGVVRQLLYFPMVVEQALEQALPSTIATYCFELANAANSFYQQCPILKAEPELRATRLAVIAAVSQVLKNGLGMLNISVLERM